MHCNATNLYTHTLSKFSQFHPSLKDPFYRKQLDMTKDMFNYKNLFFFLEKVNKFSVHEKKQRGSEVFGNLFI